MGIELHKAIQVDVDLIMTAVDAAPNNGIVYGAYCAAESFLLVVVWAAATQLVSRVDNWNEKSDTNQTTNRSCDSILKNHIVVMVAWCNI